MEDGGKGGVGGEGAGERGWRGRRGQEKVGGGGERESGFGGFQSKVNADVKQQGKIELMLKKTMAMEKRNTRVHCTDDREERNRIGL